MAWVDVFFAVVLIFSIILGVWRGFLFEVMSLAGWVVAGVLAYRFSPFVAAHIGLAEQGSLLNQTVSFAGVFIVALLVWSVICRFSRMMLHATVLSVLDRVLGGLFGSVRGALILLLITAMVSLTPLARSAAWQQCTLAPWLQLGVGYLKPLLPAPLSQRLAA